VGSSGRFRDDLLLQYSAEAAEKEACLQIFLGLESSEIKIRINVLAQLVLGTSA
jgi:hypothetical protein